MSSIPRIEQNRWYWVPHPYTQVAAQFDASDWRNSLIRRPEQPCKHDRTTTIAGVLCKCLSCGADVPLGTEKTPLTLEERVARLEKHCGVEGAT